MNCREAIPDHPATTSFAPVGVVLDCRCPRCGAEAGQICRRASKQPKSHIERLYIAQGHYLECLPHLANPTNRMRSPRAPRRETTWNRPQFAETGS